MEELKHATNVFKLPLPVDRRCGLNEPRATDEFNKQLRSKQSKRGATMPAFRPDTPEQRLRMKRTDALDLFEPLPLPPTWRVYITAPSGEVAARMAGCGRLLRAALLLQELGTVQLAQRRTEHGTEYLIRRSFG